MPSHTTVIAGVVNKNSRKDGVGRRGTEEKDSNGVGVINIDDDDQRDGY